MSQTTIIERLREELRKVEEELKRLEDQKKELDEKYSSVQQEENRVAEELRACRDPYKYNQLEMRLNMVSRQRKETEAVKEEVERKIRGYQEETAKIQARIEYLKPRESKFVTERGQ